MTPELFVAIVMFAVSFFAGVTTLGFGSLSYFFLNSRPDRLGAGIITLIVSIFLSVTFFAALVFSVVEPEGLLHLLAERLFG